MLLSCRSLLLCALLLAAAAAPAAPAAHAAGGAPAGSGGGARRSLQQVGSRLTTETDVQLFFGRSSARYRAIREPAPRPQQAAAAGDGDSVGDEDSGAASGADGATAAAVPATPSGGKGNKPRSSGGAGRNGTQATNTTGVDEGGAPPAAERGADARSGGATDQASGHPHRDPPACLHPTGAAAAAASAASLSSRPLLASLPAPLPPTHQAVTLILTPQQLEAIVQAAKRSGVGGPRERPTAGHSLCDLCGPPAPCLRARPNSEGATLCPPLRPSLAGRRRRAREDRHHHLARAGSAGPAGPAGSATLGGRSGCERRPARPQQPRGALARRSRAACQCLHCCKSLRWRRRRPSTVNAALYACPRPLWPPATPLQPAQHRARCPESAALGAFASGRGQRGLPYSKAERRAWAQAKPQAARRAGARQQSKSLCSARPAHRARIHTKEPAWGHRAAAALLFQSARAARPAQQTTRAARRSQGARAPLRPRPRRPRRIASGRPRRRGRAPPHSRRSPR
jgi:hypothetical protein